MFAFFTQRVYCHLFVALAAGIAIGRYWSIPYGLLVNDWVLVAIPAAGVGLIWWLWRDLEDWKASCLGLALVMLIGYVSSSLTVGIAISAPLRDFAAYEPTKLLGKVATIPKYQRGHLRFILDVESAGGEPAAGKCFAYVKCESPPRLYMTDRIALWASLSEVAGPLNRGEFDYRAYLLRQGTVMTAYATGARQLERLSSILPEPWATTAQIRQLFVRNLQAAVPGDLGLLAVSVVFGDKITELPDDLETRFRLAGLTHILVASGTQVSLLIALVALLFWRITDDFSWVGLLKASIQFGITMGVVIVYASITGFDTSIVRALLMGALIMVGRLFRREADGLSILAQSGLILLVANPLALFSPGFQLSFGATFGLIYILGAAYPLVIRLSGWRAWTVGILVSTGGAQLFVAPLVASSFHQFSAWGMASNLVAIPAAFALLINGTLLSLGVGMIPLVGKLLGWSCLAISWFLNYWAGLFAALPGSSVAVPHQPLWWTLSYYALIFILVEQLKYGRLPNHWQRSTCFALSLALGLLLVGTTLSWLLVPKPGLTTLSLKKGEAYIWRPFTGQTVVFARTTGLGKSHNADKLQDALMFRGINMVHGWHWIGGDPGGSSLFEPPLRFESSSSPGIENLDVGWITTPSRTIGAVFGLGQAKAIVLWDWGPKAMEAVNHLGLSELESRVAILGETAAKEISEEQLVQLATQFPLILTRTKPKQVPQGIPGLVLCEGEFELKPKAIEFFQKGKLATLPLN